MIPAAYFLALGTAWLWMPLWVAGVRLPPVPVPGKPREAGR